MKIFESDIIRWLLRTVVILIGVLCGLKITIALLAYTLGSIGFFAFTLTSLVVSYFFVWFAWFGLPSLLTWLYRTQQSRAVTPASAVVLFVFFAVPAVMSASVTSAIVLIRVVEQMFPEHSILLWLIGVPFFVFILYLAVKVDKEAQIDIGGQSHAGS